MNLRKVGFLIMVVGVGLVLGGCQRVSVITAFDPGKQPVMDSQLNPGFSSTHPTVCKERSSAVSGREDHCRVIRGYEDHAGGWPDENKNWVIDYTENNIWTEGPLAYFSWPGNPQEGQHPWFSCPAGADLDPYGCTIVVDGWGMFSGCDFNRDGNDYVCDYYERNQQIGPANPSNMNFLRATIDWAKYIKNAASCALSAYKVTITNPMLVACDDAIWGGPLPEQRAAGDDDPIITGVTQSVSTDLLLGNGPEGEVDVP